MSLPASQNQSVSTYKREKRTASSRRNISNPYNLAIPPSHKRSYRTLRSSSEYGTSSRPSLKSVRSADTLQTPRKATTSSSNLARQHASSEKTPVAFIGFEHYQRRYETIEKKPKICGIVRDRLIALLVTFAIAVILAIAIPLGIILPQRLIKPLPINVLIPFSVEPAPGAWDPLYDAIIKHIETNFTIVINPDNGPGTSVRPTGEYIKAVESLSKYLNVKTLGYIDAAGGSRKNATVRKEIEKYAGWSNISAEMTLGGIYFDHTPYVDENNAAAYLANISATVRDSEGFGERAFVLHSPGRVPDPTLMKSKPDITVIFEGPYDNMPRREELNTRPVGTVQKREDLAMLVHSVPQDLGSTGLRKIIDDVRKDVEWLYITDRTEKVYESYGTLLKEWLDVIW